MRRTIFGLFLLLIWCLLSGHTLLTGDTDLWMNLFALGAVGAVLAVAARMKIDDEEGVPLAIHSPGLVTFIPWLLWQVVMSNIDVARRILTMDIAPEWRTTSPKQQTAIGRVLYANSITLTPGTVSVRMDEGDILVHALHHGSAEDISSDTLNDRVAAMERP